MAHEEQIPPNQIVAQLLLKHFQPAGENDAKKEQKTTGDMFLVLGDHAPGKFTAEHVYDAMIGNGFQDKLVGQDLVWLVKPR